MVRAFLRGGKILDEMLRSGGHARTGLLAVIAEGPCSFTAAIS
jgi:hypothetical protein